ncbi:MAG: PIN domain-containing protein [Gammaproteobacteria bacterium]|nr:PIN domain-containing protein [Gammaproteobacteria bacterium]
MIVLDTNIISELAKKNGNENVIDWFYTLDRQSVVTTSITVAELLYGIYILPDGKRKTELEKTVSYVLGEVLDNPVLEFDYSAAHAYGALCAKLRVEGIAISQNDDMIAAIVLVHDGVLVTRNTKDFASCGIEVLNPFE